MQPQACVEDTGRHPCAQAHTRAHTHTHTRAGLSSPALPPAPAAPGPHYPTPHRTPKLRRSPRGPSPAGPMAEQPGHMHGAPLSTATLVSPSPYPVPGRQNLGPESPAVVGLVQLSPAQHSLAQLRHFLQSLQASWLPGRDEQEEVPDAAGGSEEPGPGILLSSKCHKIRVS